MKILLLNHNYEGFGTYHRCFRLGQQLAVRGHDVTLFCATDGERSLRTRTTIDASGLRVITFPRVRLTAYHTGHSLRALLFTAWMLRERWDIVHAFAVAQPTVSLPAVVAWALRRGRLIVDWDDAWGEGFALEHPRPVRITMRLLERHVCRLGRYLTVVSDELLRQAVALGVPESRIIRIGNGSVVGNRSLPDRDAARAGLSIPADEFAVVSVGRTYTDGLSDLLRALVSARARVPGLRAYFVGLEDADYARHAAAIEGLAPIVVRPGVVPLETAERYLRAADVLALPMSNNMVDRCRFPIRLGDYLAAGRPVVSNAVGEARRVLIESAGGLLSDPGDDATLSDHIVALACDRERATTMGMAGQRYAERHLRWRELADQLDAVYRAALETAPAR